MFTKTASAVLTVAVLATSGAFATTTANAAPMIRSAAVETGQATQVGYYGGYYGGYNNYYYQPHCFWKKRRFWDGYYYYWKRVRICY